MIKTYINRHDLEYFVYAMARAFYKDALILAPDTAEHNKAVDEVAENEDVISFNIDNKRLLALFSKGQYFEKNMEYEFTISNFASENDAALKDEVRGFIYDSFLNYTGTELPWGNLTGIRPTKLYLQQLKKNLELTNEAGDNGIREIDSEENILAVTKYMQEKYRVSNKKNRLGADIAIRENDIMASVHSTDGYSLYIGIPFCPSTCLYCSFTSFPICSYKNRIEEYLAAVRKELVATAEIMNGYHLDTIYIGGGTPTTLEAEELNQLLNDIVSILPMEEVKEFTVEAGRADSITKEKLETIKKYPVTRISVNPQTMNDKTLKLIGRHHDSKATKDAFNLARKIGFDNINMDIILGLPEETAEDVEYTLNEIMKLLPESLTVHSLAIKRASRMKEYMETHNIECKMNLDEAMNLSTKYAEKMQLDPYYMYRQKDMAGNLENTGFAKKGMYGIYNILMIEEVQSIVACGAGTVTKRVFEDGHIERCDTAKDVNLYIDKIDEMIERKRQLFSSRK